MGLLVGILIRIFKLILYLAIVVAFIILIPNLPPYTKFSRIEIEPTQPRVGALAPNDDLNNAEPLYKDKLLGPEAFQIFNDELYTGLATGEIVKVSPGGHVTFVTKIGQPCTGLIQEHICGRPLGFVIDEKNKYMYVADAYYGIWKVNLITDKKQLLVSPRVEIDERVPKIFNSVALDNNGDLYWTDSSSDAQLKDGAYAVLADPSGRLFKYDAVKNNSQVLLDDLWFANGLAISPDGQFVVVAETSKYRLTKYYINGPKKGSSEVFVAGLPGLPDNIRALPDGSGILVSLYNVFDEEHPLLIKSMAPAPLARKFLARLLRLIEIPFEFVQTIFPNYIFEKIVYQIGSIGSLSSLTPHKTGLLQINWNGKIVASYYNTDGTLRHISDAIVYKNKLYTGCPHSQNFIGSVPAPSKLKEAFTVKKHAAPEMESVKQTTSQPAKQPTVQSTLPNDIPKETLKQNTVPKDVTPRVIPKENKNKQKENSKIVDNNKKEAGDPNVIVKDSKAKVEHKNDIVKPKINQKDEKLKVQTKDANIKAKTLTQTEIKPKDSPQADTKSKIEQPVDKKSKTAQDETKPKNIPKDKIQPKVESKDEKSKVQTKDANIKPKTVPQTETKPKDSPQADTKSKIEQPVDKKSKTAQDETKPKNIPKDKLQPKVESKDEIKSNIVSQVEKIPKSDTKSKIVPKKDSSGVPVEQATVKPNVETKPKEPKENKSKVQPAAKPTEQDEDGKLKVESQKIKKEYPKADAKTPTETEPQKANKPKQVTETKTTKDETKPAQPVSTPKPIPVTENIPSDTAQPNKETLKVIKKSGPQEIRNPNL